MCTYFWWPIVYTYLLMVNQSVRMKLFDGLFFIHTSERWLKSYKYHLFMTYFVVFGGLFSTQTSPCLTYSMQVPPLLDLLGILTNSMAYFVYFFLLRELIRKVLTEFLDICLPFDLNSISTTSSWPSLSTSDFYDLLCFFTSPWWAHIYIFYGYVHVPLLTYSVQILSLGDLFCTQGTC